MAKEHADALRAPGVPSWTQDGSWRSLWLSHLRELIQNNGART